MTDLPTGELRRMAAELIAREGENAMQFALTRVSAAMLAGDETENRKWMGIVDAIERHLSGHA